jgi:hypothetical protein
MAERPVYIRGASKSDIDQSCDEHSSYADCDDCQSCHELLFSPQVFGISLSGKLWAALHVMCKIQELCSKIRGLIPKGFLCANDEQNFG